MSWTFVTFSPESKVRPHALHPHAKAARLRDLKDRHGAAPVAIRSQSEVMIDLGGMIHMNAPCITIDLGKTRQLSVWEHHAVEVAAALRRLTPVQLAGRSWFRVGSFPGIMIYLSAKDRTVVLRRLDAVADPDAGERHRAAVHEALGAANQVVLGHHPEMH